MSKFSRLSHGDVAKLLLKMKKIDIAVHRSPDADAIGSALALREISSALGIDAKILSADPIPETLEFLEYGRYVTCEPREGAELIAVDVASPSQLGELEKHKDGFRFMIDHHGRGEAFADFDTVPDAAAAGEIVYDIITEITSFVNIAVPKAVYTYLFAAISGDTGSFRFANTTYRTFEIAAELKRHGADTEWCSRMLHGTRTLGSVYAEKLALEKMKLECGGRLAITSASRGDIASLGLKNEDFSDISDMMRSISGVLVGASLREINEGEWRVSMRANAPVDCASVAVRYGGGGHMQAAGCSICGTDEESAVEMITSSLAAAIDEYERKK